MEVEEQRLAVFGTFGEWLEEWSRGRGGRGATGSMRFAGGEPCSPAAVTERWVATAPQTRSLTAGESSALAVTLELTDDRGDETSLKDSVDLVTARWRRTGRCRPFVDLETSVMVFRDFVVARSSGHRPWSEVMPVRRSEPADVSRGLADMVSRSGDPASGKPRDQKTKVMGSIDEMLDLMKAVLATSSTTCPWDRRRVTLGTAITLRGHERPHSAMGFPDAELTPSDKALLDAIVVAFRPRGHLWCPIGGWRARRSAWVPIPRTDIVRLGPCPTSAILRRSYVQGETVLARARLAEWAKTMGHVEGIGELVATRL